MNNPHPIKRHQALVSFSRDHHFGLLLVWKIKHGLEHGIAPQRISNYVLHFFEQDLRQHFEEEEKTLFPLLPPDDKLRKQAQNEHAAIIGLIELLRTDGENKYTLLRFAAMLKDHIRFEERKLFTAIEQATGSRGQVIPEAHHHNRGNEVDESWHDPFWVVEKKCSR